MVNVSAKTKSTRKRSKQRASRLPDSLSIRQGCLCFDSILVPLMTSEYGDGDSEYGGRELEIQSTEAEIRHKDAPCLTFCKRPSPFDGRIATESIVVRTSLLYPFAVDDAI